MSYVDDNILVKHIQEEDLVTKMIDEMSKSLQEWLQILQLIKGLKLIRKVQSQHNFKVETKRMEKKYDYGDKITDTGDKKIKPIKENSQQEKHERLDPWEAERILGLSLPITGSMTEELKFRKKQLDQFGQQIYKSLPK